jgi:hypothetical protein
MQSRLAKVPYSALLGLYLAAGISAGLISWYTGQSQNLLVFLQSARDFLSGANLYELHTVEWYKYSPTFAIFFIPFLWIPAPVAAAAWSALNFGAVYAGARGLLSKPEDDKASLLLSLLGIVLMTDGDQANLLITGTTLLAYKALERRKLRTFAMYVAIGTLVKIFPLLGLGMLAPRKPFKESVVALLWFALFFALLFALPLLYMSSDSFVTLLRSWRALVSAEAIAIRGWSVLGMLEEMFHFGLPNFPLQLIGALLLSVPFALSLVRPSTQEVRLNLALSIVMFVVLWNHRSEYCTLVISATAMCVQYMHGPRKRLDILLLVLALVLTAPFFNTPEPKLHGPLAFLGAHRRFAWFRMIPLTVIWLRLQWQLIRALLASESTQSETAG